MDKIEADRILNEFLNLVKLYFSNPTWTEKYYNDFYEYTSITDINCNKYESGRIIVYITFCKKSIKIFFTISLYHNQQNNHNIYIHTHVHSNDSDYKFDLHDYVVNRYGMFKDYKEDWTSYEANLSEYPNLKMATTFFFEKLKQLIETEDMQRILNTDYAPEIPIDWSRCGYK